MGRTADLIKQDSCDKRNCVTGANTVHHLNKIKVSSTNRRIISYAKNGINFTDVADFKVGRE